MLTYLRPGAPPLQLEPAVHPRAGDVLQHYTQYRAGFSKFFPGKISGIPSAFLLQKILKIIFVKITQRPIIFFQVERGVCP
jgi:hypothetical protein